MTRKNPYTGLTDRQAEAAGLLAMGFTAKATAKELGVSRVTVQRYKKIPEFKAMQKTITTMLCFPQDNRRRRKRRQAREVTFWEILAILGQ